MASCKPQQMVAVGKWPQSMGQPCTMTSNGRLPLPTIPTSTSGEERKKKDQKVAPEMQKIQHMLGHRWEPAASWFLICQLTLRKIECSKYQQPFNSVTDSAFVEGVDMRAEHSFLK